MTLAPVRLSESAQTAALSVTHAPIGKGGTNWITKSKPGNTGQLPAYIQNVRNAIMRDGTDEGRAHAIAIGRVEDWAAGKGNVSAEVKAAAAKAVAELKAMGAKSKATSALKETLGETRRIRESALKHLAVLEQALGGVDGMIALLAEGALVEAANFTPTLKRVASAQGEVDRHHVYDGGQHVATIARRRGFGSEGDRHSAFAVNGDRLTDYSERSQQGALDAVKRHLEEAPGRVMPHPSGGGKFLVARPASYSGTTSYTEAPSEALARHAAGLPPSPTSVEVNSKVKALAEGLTIDLMFVSELDIGPLRRVQEARRLDPFDLAEAFNPGERRGPHGKWIGNGRRELHPSSLPGRSTLKGGRDTSAAAGRYASGATRESAKLRAAHAAKPQIEPKDLAASVGSHPAADRATQTLLKQPHMDADKLASEVTAGRARDTEHLHRKLNANGSLGAYSPERKALHEQILSNMLQGKGVHGADSRAIFTAGGPASGKSGLEKFGMLTLPKDVVHADPDTIRTMLPEYKALVKAGRADASSLTHEEASHLAKVLTRLALGRQHHILVDTVGDSGKGKFAGKIKQAQAAGHKVSVHYATTDVKTALDRSAERAKRTGRHVPESYLRIAHQDVSTRFMEEIRHLEGIHLQVVDTTDRPNSVIAERHPSDNLAIKDAAKYKRFLDKAKG